MLKKSNLPENPSGKYYFLNNDKILGSFVIQIRENNSLSIWNLEIFPEFRGNGFGKKMVQECLELVKEKFPGFAKIWLLVHVDNIRARKLYESVGFSYNETLEGVSKMEILL